ncbi:MAG: glutamate-1-semialdehyde 2,1-aminomutase [Nitrososphaerota archaeon]|nr:glutamate-1-semialdehyde 2,1-aminomutase [Nitrososphaerota archaeon]
MRNETRSEKMFAEAQKILVGGVDSPVRSFSGVGRKNPVFVTRARGSKIYDVDGNRYIDYVCSWGALILGSAHPDVVAAVKKSAANGLSFGAATRGEVELALMIRERMPALELVRFVSSGTEATMSALRVARAFTNRTKILKFEGCYHGHADSFLVKAGSGLATFSVADSAGVPASIASETLVARYNDIRSVERILEANPRDVAAIIVEPVAGNMGVVPPVSGFLRGLRKLCDEFGCLLIFDEVITGFRVARGGAQELYSVKPDLTCIGKIIGGGTNIAGYGGRSDVMKLVSPIGPVYQAGTLSGNPLAVSAGISTLTNLTRSTYRKIENSSSKMESILRTCSSSAGVKLVVQRVTSMLGMFFIEEIDKIESYDQVARCDREKYAKFFSALLDSGIYFPPSPFETIFVSSAHSSQDLVRTRKAADSAFGVLSD